MTTHKDITNQSKNIFKDLPSRLNKVHGDKYDYSKSIYKNMKEKITIICPTHGEFSLSTDHHLRGRGCPKCSKENLKQKQLLTTEEFIAMAKEIHGDKYDYSKSVYTRNNAKINIVCSTHGVFAQTPINHWKGNNCPFCANITRAEAKTKSTELFIAEARAIHGNKYNYSDSVYTGVKNRLHIICPTHGSFEQTPNEHLVGSGCQSCATYGFDYNIPAILYYLSINNGEAYKIGITNSTVENRYYKELDFIKVLWTKNFKTGKEAYLAEQNIKKKFEQFKYLGKPLLISGNTELFIENVCPTFTSHSSE